MFHTSNGTSEICVYCIYRSNWGTWCPRCTAPALTLCAALSQMKRRSQVLSMPTWCWISCAAMVYWKESVSAERVSPTEWFSMSSNNVTRSLLPQLFLVDSWMVKRPVKNFLMLCNWKPMSTELDPARYMSSSCVLLLVVIALLRIIINRGFQQVLK